MDDNCLFTQFCFMKGFIEMLFFWIAGKPIPFLLTEKNPKENFCFYRKRQKVKIEFSICLQQVVVEAVPKYFPGTYTHHLSIKPS